MGWLLAVGFLALGGAIWLLAARRRFRRTIRELVDAVRQDGGTADGDTGSWLLLRQRGELRLRADGPWLPFEAQQWIAITRPAFVWDARVRTGRIVRARVIDAFDGRDGRLEARLFGVVPIAGSSGRGTSRAQLQRYLAELPWCPPAMARNRALRFERLDERRSRVHVAFDGEDVWVDLERDCAGRVVAAAADRVRRVGARDVKTPWRGEFADYRSFDGTTLPVRATVEWRPPEGTFRYFRGEIVSVERGTSST